MLYVLDTVEGERVMVSCHGGGCYVKLRISQNSSIERTFSNKMRSIEETPALCYM